MSDIDKVTPIKLPPISHPDMSRLISLNISKNMLENFRATESKTGRITMDSLFIQVPRTEYELLVDLSIELLQSRVKTQHNPTISEQLNNE